MQSLAWHPVSSDFHVVISNAEFGFKRFVILLTFTLQEYERFCQRQQR